MVKAAIPERCPGAVALQKKTAAGMGALGLLFQGHVKHFLGQIDAGYPAVGLAGRLDGHVGRSRGDVEDVLAVADSEGAHGPAPPDLVDQERQRAVAPVIGRRHPVEKGPDGPGPFVQLVFPCRMIPWG